MPVFVWFVIWSSPAVCPRLQELYRDKTGIPPGPKRGGCALRWGSTSCTYLCPSYRSRHCYPSKQDTVSSFWLSTETPLSWEPCTLHGRAKGREKDAFAARSGTGQEGST